MYRFMAVVSFVSFAASANQAVTQPAAGGGVTQTREQLQQLVAPIALYPDALVSQILPASAYPNEIVEADRWMQQHSNLKGEQLAQEVDKQSWDPSVKALTQFPSVLANMDKSPSWTSALGEAYTNQQQGVFNAVQVMRQRAQKAGNLQSTAQQAVTTQGQTIVIQPANPDVVYVPVYDPWVVYGPPIAIYPGWVPVGGLYAAGPGISFGLGFGVGVFAGFGWGWHHWGADWHDRTVVYNDNTYVSHHDGFHRGGENLNHGEGFHGGGPAGHRDQGLAEPHARGFAVHGPTSVGGGFHGGAIPGGGLHAGGFHGGGLHGGGFHAGAGGFHAGAGGFHGGAGGFHGGGFHAGGRHG